jgi:hypothetical protein
LGACGSIGRRGAATGGQTARCVIYLTTRLPERLIGSSLIFSRLFCGLFVLLPGWMFGPGVTMYASLHTFGSDYHLPSY